MKPEAAYYLGEMERLFANRTCRVEESDYREFESNKRLLRKISEVENSSLAVFDTHKMHYTLLCSKFDKAVGYRLNHDFRVSPAIFYEKMHPDDFPFVLETIIRTLRYVEGLQPHEKTDYKLIVGFRLRNASGAYLRFVQQVVVLELDRDGQVWLILKIFDLVSDRATDEPPQRKLLNLKTGRLHLFTDDNPASSGTVLTKRETEILGLISQGLDSKVISDRLFISVHTVNNHRQNILGKTGSVNMSQALLYAKRIGII